MILWAMGFFIDSFWPFDSLPITTVMVLLAWHNVRKKAREAKEELGSLSKKTQQEIEKIDQELDEVFA